MTDTNKKTDDIIHYKYNIQDIIEENLDTPFPISIIPNYMGINLCSVDSIEWTEQSSDNQLINLTINFIPKNNE